MIKAIDVSKHQGEINWIKVKAASYSAAMIRAGWSWFDGGMNIDPFFHANMEGAQAAGLDVGVYLYSYDLTPAAARIAAQRLLEVLRPYKLTMPVAFDLETDDSRIKKKGRELTGPEAVEIADSFLSVVEGAGYYTVLYSFASWMNSLLDDPKLDRYDKWVAHFQTDKPAYAKSYGMWQFGVIGTVGRIGRDYTIIGTVPGVQGNCDVNYVYKDYPGIIKAAGLNGWGTTGEADGPQDGTDLDALLTEVQAERDAALAKLAQVRNIVL